MRNKRRLAAIVVFALAAIVMAGGLTASNMGFKLALELVGGGAGSISGTNAVGLPYNRQVGIDDAQAWFGDMKDSGIAVQNIQNFTPVNDANVPYGFGDSAAASFALEASRGYLVKVGVTGTYIAVGSHDPSLNVVLNAGSASSISGTQRYSHPWHGVSSTASELFAELKPDVQNIQRFNPVNDANVPYGFGDPAAADFPIEPGKAYLVKMGSDKTFVPAHY